MKVQELLKQKRVKFDVVPHEHAYTAQEVAASEHVTGHQFAKTVIVRGDDGQAYMLVLPASRHVDFRKAAEMIGTDVEMVGEEDMKALFPDTDIGAEPPFGSQYNVKTFVDESLADKEHIVFRAGTHDQTIKMKYADYVKVEKPTVGQFAIMAG